VAHRARTLAVTGAAAAALAAVPVSAHAATKSVTMGVPVASQKAFGVGNANAFFPRTTTIHVGDTVAFVPAGFHNADFPARGGNPVPFFTPAGSTATSVNDAAGAAFWFNGQPNFGPNLSLLKGSFGKTLKYTGAKAVNSGIPLGAKPKPFKLTFGKAGTFTYFCDIHPGMKGTVRVVGKAAKVPSAKEDARAVKTQVAAALKSVKTLSATTPPANTILLGAAGPKGVEVFKFFPETSTVPVGTTVKFEMSPGSYEAHTATVGPGNPEQQPDSYLGKLTASFESPQIDPIALYPSEAPGTVPAVTPTSHGNGFWNSGVLDASSASPLPSSSSVRFDAPGTYQFYCLIHPFMHATVNVG
jgi:plastocyanin